MMQQQKHRTLQQMIPDLLKLSNQKKIMQALKEYDQIYIENKRFQMIKKMPLQLRPNQTTLSKIQGSKFTDLYTTVNENAYEYSKENLSNIFEAMKLKKEENNSELMQQEKRQGQFRVQIQEGEQAIPGIRSAEQNRTLAEKLFGLQTRHPRQHSDPNKYPPFVGYSSNFTDVHANAKHNKQKNYLQNFSQTSQNLAYLARGSKLQAFNTFGYPSSIMKGNIQHPKNTIFAKGSQLNIKDVMRYTLGVKDDSTINGNYQRIVNPFNRPPSLRK